MSFSFCVFLQAVQQTVNKYIEMMLALIEIYLLDDIARQRDMSKITK